MKCKVCKESNILLGHYKKRVAFYCPKGHSWTEDYIDNNGTHQRPSAYLDDINEILFPNEKSMYERLLYEISSDTNFFKSASLKEIVAYLVDICAFDKQALLLLFRKIDEFNKMKT